MKLTEKQLVVKLTKQSQWFGHFGAIKTMKLVIVVVLVLVGVTMAQVDWKSPCYFSSVFVRPFQNSNQQESIQGELEIPKNCSQGTIDWQYPTGKLRISHKRVGVHFTFCLYGSWGTYFAQVDEIRNNVIKEISLPTKDAPACTKDYNGETQLLVTAPESMMYMNNVDYRVVVDKPSSRHVPVGKY